MTCKNFQGMLINFIVHHAVSVPMLKRSRSCNKLPDKLIFLSSEILYSKFTFHLSELLIPTICNLYLVDSNKGNHPFGDMEPQTHMAQIGISVEPLSQLMQQTPANSKTSTVEPFVEFANKMCENLYNFTASFGQTQAQMTPNPGESYVPLSKLQQWYQNFLRKLEQNPYFWRS